MSKLQQQTAQTIAANQSQLFHAKVSPKVGAKNADITIVEFFDYQCSYCRKIEPVIAKLIQTDNKVNVIYKHLPIFGENSIYAAKLALAAQQQGKFSAFHQALMAINGDFDKKALLTAANTVGLNTQKLEKDSQNTVYTQELEANQKLANNLNIMGTPAFIFAKTKNTSSKNAYYYLPMAARYETFQTIISRLRQNN
jgi:protein-disulfide isomerase